METETTLRAVKTSACSVAGIVDRIYTLDVAFIASGALAATCEAKYRL